MGRTTRSYYHVYQADAESSMGMHYDRCIKKVSDRLNIFLQKKKKQKKKRFYCERHHSLKIMFTLIINQTGGSTSYLLLSPASFIALSSFASAEEKC